MGVCQAKKQPGAAKNLEISPEVVEHEPMRRVLRRQTPTTLARASALALICLGCGSTGAGGNDAAAGGSGGAAASAGTGAPGGSSGGAAGGGGRGGTAGATGRVYTTTFPLTESPI